MAVMGDAYLLDFSWKFPLGSAWGAHLLGGASGGDEGERVQLTVPLSSGEQQVLAPQEAAGTLR